MKKLFSVFLIAVLLCSAMIPAASASTDYTENLFWLPLMYGVLDSSPQNMVSQDARGMTVVCFILDAVSLGILESSDLDYSKDFYLSRYGSSTLDLYMPLKSGGYYNLFYLCNSVKLSDYGKGYSTSFKTDTTHIYKAVKPSEIEEAVLLLDSLLSEH